MRNKIQVNLRLELLESGEKLGYPRLGYAFNRVIRAGEASWTAFANRAALKDVAPALRTVHVLGAQGLEPPVEGSHASVMAQDAEALRKLQIQRARQEGAAKAREIRAKKKAEEQAKENWNRVFPGVMETSDA